jgi:hypothetical protein
MSPTPGRVAQWISAPDFGSGGRRFDPGRVRWLLFDLFFLLFFNLFSDAALPDCL